MKKITSILVVLLMVLAMAGCGKKDAGENKTYLDELIKEKVITVATSPDYPPFENLDLDTNEISGFDIDLINILAEKMGVTVELVSMSFDTIVSAVQAGTVDLGVSGFSVDPDKQVLFTSTYYDAGQSILVTKESGYKTLADMAGKTIACQLGTTMIEAVKESVENPEIITGEDNKVLVEALKAGQYDGVGLDTVVAQAFAKANDSLVVLEESMVSDEYAMIANNDHALLIAKLNEVLAEFMNTQEYQDLLNKWGM